MTLQLKERIDVNVLLKYVDTMISKDITTVLLITKDDETRKTRKFISNDEIVKMCIRATYVNGRK